MSASKVSVIISLVMGPNIDRMCVTNVKRKSPPSSGWNESRCEQFQLSLIVLMSSLARVVELRAFKYRLYPSRKQEARWLTQFYLCRGLYNGLLQQCKTAYKIQGKMLSKTELCKIITGMKENHPELSSVYSQVLQNCADRLVKAYGNFFNRVRLRKQGAKVKVGFPRFKKHWQSITYPQFGFKLGKNERGSSFLEVSKLGRIAIILHRPIEGEIKTLTVKRNHAGQWYATFACDEPIAEKRHPHADSEVGVDVGLESFATLSDGTKIDNPRHLIKAERRLKRRQRKLSRTEKGSRGRWKARRSLAKLHVKISNQRENFLHQLSRQLANQYGTIKVEDLAIQNMMRNHHLAKHIVDASWGRFIEMLSYKESQSGGRVIAVNSYGTSQRCSRCGEIVRKDLSDRSHVCPKCALRMDRDRNSAINILNGDTAGLAGIYARGDYDLRNPQRGSSQVYESGTICGSEGLATKMSCWKPTTSQ